MSAYTENIDRLTLQYNDAIRALENSYRMEKSFGGSGSVYQLKRQYSQRYEQLASEYRTKSKQLLEAYKRQNPSWTRQRKIWEWVFVVGLFMLMMGCTATLASLADDEKPASSTATLSSSSAVTYWNADNIDIPYLRDSTQYVSNPDHILSQGALERINTTLHAIEHDFGIQTIFIVVNHIENDDPFRMAQDVGNKYGVGYHDRGLVVVVGYEDHSINMSPGRSLEADLTDAECHRLERQYVIPSMRAEMPDSGMVYLAQAVYATLQKKELPAMSQLASGSDETDDAVATVMGIFMLLLVAGAVGFLRLNRTYHWLGMVGSASLLANPFYEASRRSGIYIGGGGGGFGGGGGGGFSGGSFGGGSFGGGGATSRW